MRGLRRVIGLLILPCLLAVPQASMARSAPTIAAAGMAAYDAGSGGSIGLTVTVDVRDRPGIVVFVFGRRDAQGRVISLQPNVVQFDATSGLRVFTPTGSFRQCPAPAVCEITAGGEMQVTVTEIVPAGTPMHRAVYAAGLGNSVRMSWQRLGPWRTRSLSSPRAAVSTDQDTYGASLNGFTGQVYTGSSLREPARSSIAVGVLPCSTLGTTSAIGLGSLEGGRTTPQTFCPGGLVAAAADRSTTWRLNGAAAGATNTAYRLVSVPLN